MVFPPRSPRLRGESNLQSDDETIWRNVLAKGIRINQLAKDLGVESKAILAKCRDEGLGEKVPNHMSVVSVGLAETIKEWFSGHDAGGGGGTAVETAPPVEAKPKATRARTKKKVETTEDAGPRDDAASDA